VFVHYVSFIAKSCVIFCMYVFVRKFARSVVCLCRHVTLCICVFACEKEKNKERRQ